METTGLNVETNYWIRVRESTRKTYFHPEDPAGHPCPFSLEEIEDWCRRAMIRPNHGTMTEETTWRDKDLHLEPQHKSTWTGKTWFRLRENENQKGVKRCETLPPPLRRVRQKATMDPEGNQIPQEVQPPMAEPTRNTPETMLEPIEESEMIDINEDEKTAIEPPPGLLPHQVRLPRVMPLSGSPQTTLHQLHPHQSTPEAR